MHPPLDHYADMTGNSHSPIFSGPCGTCLLVCFSLGLVLFIAMVCQTTIYFYRISSDPNILCVSNSVSLWIFLFPIEWGAFFLVCSFLMFSMHISEKRAKIHIKLSVVLLLLGIFNFLLRLYVSPLSDQTGTIIRQPDKQHIMYQYQFDGVKQQAFPIFLSDEPINTTELNMTCTPLKASARCSIEDLMSHLNVSSLFLCKPGSDDGLSFVLSYLEPISDYSKSSVNINVGFMIFFVYACLMTIYRTLVRPENWCEIKLCTFSGEHVTNERTGLVKKIQLI